MTRTTTDDPPPRDGGPLMSVVTPSYNQAEFIEDTILSVANQRYPRIEHVIVDGESDDGTVDILESYDDRVTWVSEPDDGQADAINKGFDMVNGDIVGWLNSDDVFFDTGVLDRVVTYFDHFNADIVYGDVGLLNADSEVLKLQVVPDFDYEKLLVGCFIEQPALFFRSDILDEHRLNTELEYAFDYEFWLRLGRNCEFRHVPDILAGDRNHDARKILHEREAMRRENRTVREKYGDSTAGRARRQRKLNLLFSGVARAVQAALRSVSMHRSPPDLAFDGHLRPLPEMVMNAARRNRNLV